MAKSLLDPTDERQVRDLIRPTLALHAERERIQRDQEELLEGMNPIALPPALRKEMVTIHAGVPSAQVQLMTGLLSEEEKARVFTTTANATDKQLAEQIEAAVNNLYRTLETQWGEVRQALRRDLCVHGYAVDVQEYLPHDFAAKMPQPDTYGASYDESGSARFPNSKKSMEYATDREAAIKRMGTPSGEWAWRWRQVPSVDFFWREDHNTGHLTLAIERQYRYLKDLLEDDRYAEALPKLRQWYASQSAQSGDGARGALTLQVQFLIVEDRNWCIYYVLPLDKQTKQPDAPNALASALARDYAGGEVAESYRNQLGRIKYTFTPGLTSTNRNPAYRYRGIFRDMTPLCKALDFYLSVKATRVKVFSFPQPLRRRAPVQAAGVDIAQSMGGDEAPLQFESGSMKVLDLEPGEDVFYMKPPEVTADEVQNVQFIQAQLDQLGIARSVKDSSGIGSGYQLEILSTNALATRKPLLRGIRQAHVHRVSVAFDIITRQVKETLYLVGGSDGADTRQVAWLKLSPDDLSGLKLNVETVFDLVKPNQASQQLDAYARSVGTEFADRETSRRQFGGREDSERIERNIALDKVKAQLMPFLIEASATKAQATIQQALQKRQQPTLQDLAQVSPTLAAYLQQQQQFPGQMGVQFNGQPPPPNGMGQPPPVTVQHPAPAGAPPPQEPTGAPGFGGQGGTPAGTAPPGMPRGPRGTGGVPGGQLTGAGIGGP